jgi:uncharacterized RDD family membrane protein YckC
MENLRLAGFGKRVLAYIIDGIVLGVALSIILIPFGGLMAVMGLDAQDGEIDNPMAMATAGLSFMGIALVAMVAPIIYDGLMTASTKQGTLGKMAMKIKVVKEDGSRLSQGEAIIRAVVKAVLGAFCFLVWLVMLFNKEQQNLHDMTVKSLVVEE